jgi:glycosyltransferase involved in cell wall biosynthesis
MTQLKICHLTSVHQRTDVRVFLKICTSLTLAGMDVSLVISDGKGDAVVNGVKIFDVAVQSESRIIRMTKTVAAVYRKALALDAQIYHFHDPELIPVGLLLKRKGKIVVFDSHEDYTSDILHKQYIPVFFRHLISKFYQSLESYSAKRFDAVVTATPKIREIFEAYGTPKVVDINNYPLLNELFDVTDWAGKTIDAIFIGAISSVRGVYELVQSLDYSIDCSLTIAGTFANSSVQSSITALGSWGRVSYLGQVSRGQVFDLLAKAKVGVVTYLPAPNHVDAQPNKLFEYMSAGIPVVASNFPLWREIVEENDCGICVDPNDPAAVSVAIDTLIKNPNKAMELGANGRNAVIAKYNWRTEEKKLLELYKSLFVKMP